MTSLRLVGAFGLVVSAALCQVPATLVVHGVGGTSATLSVTDLAKLPQQTVKVTDHGTPATFEGVLLADVLAKVAVPAGEKFHSTAASYYLLVEAKDGYRATFVGGTGFHLHGQIRVRGHHAGWQATLGKGRAISFSGAR